jgi:polysaccharide export outer membrane protein
MKKSLVLLFIFSFIWAQIPSGEPNDQTVPNIPSPQGGEDSQTIPSPLLEVPSSVEGKGEGKGEGDISSEGNPSESAEIRVNQTSEGSDQLLNNPVTELLPPDEGDTYLIESGDLLEIIILGEEELSRTLMVMHNGTISFPLIGEVKVAGLTTEQAAELIAEKLKKYYTHPVVSIIFKSPTLPYVSVFGEVLRQGAVEYQRGLRVTDYIALAGGPTTKANLSKVKVVRFQTDGSFATTIDVNEILDKGMLDKNFELKSGDWIHIDKKFSINWGTVLQFATLALTAANLYLTIDRLNE